ncbi:hypothetical protein BHE74_00014516 [Ensete ventricosum]|nr:hypothetical protein BHE74_00014516 [Ensete ventricosum]
MLQRGAPSGRSPKPRRRALRASARVKPGDFIHVTVVVSFAVAATAVVFAVVTALRHYRCDRFSSPPSLQSLVFTTVAAVVIAARSHRCHCHCRSSHSRSGQLVASFLLLSAVAVVATVSAAALSKQLSLSISASPRLYSSLLLTYRPVQAICTDPPGYRYAIAVPPKSIVGDRLREKKGRRRRRKKKKRRREKYLLARVPSSPVGRQRAVAALAHGRFFSRARRRNVSLRWE